MGKSRLDLNNPEDMKMAFDLETWYMAHEGIITIPLDQYNQLPVETTDRFLGFTLASNELQAERMKNAGK